MDNYYWYFKIYVFLSPLYPCDIYLICNTPILWSFKSWGGGVKVASEANYPLSILTIYITIPGSNNLYNWLYFYLQTIFNFIFILTIKSYYFMLKMSIFYLHTIYFGYMALKKSGRECLNIDIQFLHCFISIIRTKFLTGLKSF